MTGNAAAFQAQTEFYARMKGAAYLASLVEGKITRLLEVSLISEETALSLKAFMLNVLTGMEEKREGDVGWELVEEVKALLAMR